MSESTSNYLDVNVTFNNSEELKQCLFTIAEKHALKIGEQNTTCPKNSNLFIKDVVDSILTNDVFNAFDLQTCKKHLEDLENRVQKLSESCILVSSVFSDLYVPVSYDALLSIFIHSDEDFRKEFYKELISAYYEEFCGHLKQKQAANVLSKVEYEHEINILLPLIKFKAAHRLMQKEDSTENQTLLKALLQNIASFFKFPRLNQEDIYTAVNNKLGSSDYNLISYDFKPLDERNGHLGLYFKLQVKVNFESREQTLNLFTKLLVSYSENSKKMIEGGASKKEEFFYMILIKYLKEYGLNSLLDFAPGCYFSRLNDVLILDDMGSLGFSAVTPNTLLEYDALRKVIQQIAKLHACSFILEEKLSEKMRTKINLNDIFGKYLQEIFFCNDDDYFMKSSFNAGVKTMYHVVKKFPEISGKLSDQTIKEKVDKGWVEHFNKLKKSSTFRNTLCHGDMYVANMLFKFDENKKCEGVSLIDFQMLRYCPPTHDLIFFLYQNCTKQTRDKYMTSLCEEYYQNLSTHFIKFGLKIEQVYPKENFKKSIKNQRVQALFQSLFYSPITMVPPKFREEIFIDKDMANEYLYENRPKLVDTCFKIEMYRTVLEGLVQDFVQLCESGDL